MERQPKFKPFAKRSLGQNFLCDPIYIEKIIQALEPSGSDTILEIGPGRGALTRRLAPIADKVIAVELDPDMVEILRQDFVRDANVSIVEADVLRVDLRKLLEGRSAKVIANLPYYISTSVLQHLIDQRSAFLEMILMFQREVVERIMAPPGSTDRGYLTVLVEAYLSVERLFDVPPNAFRPVPKVWSSVVRMRPRAGEAIDPQFTALVSAGFAQKRKTILNNIKNRYQNAAEALRSAGIDTTRRAETLSLGEWKVLASELRAATPPPSA